MIQYENLSYSAHYLLEPNGSMEIVDSPSTCLVPEEEDQLVYNPQSSSRSKTKKGVQPKTSSNESIIAAEDNNVIQSEPTPTTPSRKAKKTVQSPTVEKSPKSSANLTSQSPIVPARSAINERSQPSEGRSVLHTVYPEEPNRISVEGLKERQLRRLIVQLQQEKKVG
jgi:cytoskeletal protein RodZ